MELGRGFSFVARQKRISFDGEHYYTRKMMNDGDNPPLGIVLYAEKSESVVKYTLSEENQQIFASKYKLYMPTEKQLENEIKKEQELLEIEKVLI